MRIEISGIVCRYGKTAAVDGVDLTINEGEFLALLGPSGSGKTTLLRILAGLEVPQAGSVRIAGEDALPIPPNERGVGFVFQHYALFRHMSVAKNISFGLDVRKRADRPPVEEVSRRVNELLELVQLPGYGGRYPQQLSGGQRQRVALARALAIEPRILLLDEPFGALDTKVRTELRVWLKALHRRLGLTAVFVTHDQSEAMELADRIVVMRSGKIEQIGAPSEVYAHPVNGFVYGFLGDANNLPCHVDRGHVVLANGWALDERSDIADGPAKAWFRPHEMELITDTGHPALDGTVLDITTLGPRGRVTLDHDGRILTADLSHAIIDGAKLVIGGPVRWRPSAVRVFADTDPIIAAGGPGAAGR